MLSAGWQEEHPGCKNSDAVLVIYLELGANDLQMVKLMPLPPYHLCFTKAAYTGCAGKKAIKRVLWLL